MELMVNPPTLGGGVALAVLFAWALGRLQGAGSLGAGLATGLGGDLADDLRSPKRGDHRAAPEQPVAAPPARVPPSLAICPQQRRSALLTALAAPDVLSDLHAEVSAFRRRERVFATLSPDLLQPALLADEVARVCLRGGVIGHPICDGAECRMASHSSASDGIGACEAAPMLQACDVNPRRARQP